MFPQLLAISMAFWVGVSAAQAPAPPAADVSKLTISAPVTIRKVDVGSVRGMPTRLAWSPDSNYLYLRVSSFDRWDNEAVRHLLLDIRTREPLVIPDEPAWLPRAWNLKSGLTSPSAASWRIRIDMREEQVRSTNVPREGNIGQHGDPGAGLDEVIRKAAMSSQKTLFENYVLSGHVIASAVNTHVAAGRTYGWAPPPHALMAFVNPKGRLVLMNEAGASREVKGAKKPSLPVWSDDGRRLAFAQPSGASGYDIKVVDIR